MRIVPPNFITEIIDRDLESGRHKEILTRFPPEPNGYLHIGHAKAIILDFGVAADYGGETNLRMDDTNPTTEDIEFVRAMQRDIEWLGFTPDRLTFASDCFEEFYQHALDLISKGLAYVDSLSEAEIREYRGSATEPGRNSPYRERSVEENLDLFQRMRAGEFAEGEHVLRARIDMSARNILMRDPLLYRIRHAHHYRTGDEWPIYPLYDYAHALTDALEGITHSLCSLEFDNNREVYDWVVENTLPSPERPHQYEFARLQLDYTVVSKRRLLELVQGDFVSGWDDPRMPTLAGLRRRGVTPAAIRDFITRVGVTKTESRTDLALLEHSIRDDLNRQAPRVLAVLDPLKVTITNYEGPGELLTAPYWPADVPREGTRELPVGRELFIERADFAQDPPKGFRRLSPGALVRLRHAYVIRCDEVITDDAGEVVELRCSYWPDSLDSNPQGVQVQGAIHWVDAATALPAEFRLYDRLFAIPDPDGSGRELTDQLNPDSLVIRQGWIEPAVAEAAPDTRFQFERQGYFWLDPEAEEGELVFNRIVTLRDSWARQEQRARASEQAAGAEAAAPPRAAAEPQAAEAPARVLTAAQQEQRGELLERYGLDEHDAELIAITPELPEFFAAAVSALPQSPRPVANWVVNELLRELKDRPLAELRITPGGLAELVGLVDSGVISARTGKEVFTLMLGSGESAAAIVRDRNLAQVSDSAELERVVDDVLAANPGQVQAYRGGKHGLAGFFVGQVMRETAGRANPQLVRELVDNKLNAAG
jgi:glutaminyl-tRNA synthetase